MHLVNGVLHNDDGPAVYDYRGIIMYYKHGEVHRDDGPAIIKPEPGLTQYTWKLNGRIQMVSEYMKKIDQGKLTLDFFTTHPEMLKYATEETVNRLDLRHIKTALTVGVI